MGLLNSCIEYEIRSLLNSACSGSKSSRDGDLVAAYLGWDGRGGMSMHEAGVPLGLTRERVRQIVDDVTGKIKSSDPDTQILEKILKYTDAAIPASCERLERDFVKQGMAKDVFRLEGIEKAAVACGIPVNFEIIKIDNARFAVPKHIDIAGTIKKLRADSVKHVTRNGASNINDYFEDIKINLSVTHYIKFIEDVMSTRDGFKWLDKEEGWFWYNNIHRNRVVSHSRKAIAVAGYVGVKELIEGIKRSFKGNGTVPPPPVLKMILNQFDQYLITDDVVRFIGSVDLEDILRPTEFRMVNILGEHGGVIRQKVFEDACLDAGIRKYDFSVNLNFSSTILRSSRGVYCLVGKLAKARKLYPLKEESSVKSKKKKSKGG